MTDPNPLRTVGVKVLEDWAMMLVDEIADRSTQFFEVGEPLYSAVVDVNGVVSGTLRIVAQRPFLDTLTRNLLGDDGTHSVEEACDAFREMGNVTAGNFITEAYGADCVFELLAPRLEELSGNDIETLRSSAMACAFSGDDQPVLFHFVLNNPV